MKRRGAMNRMWKPGTFWYVELTWRGKRIRRSTRCEDREAAEKVVRRIEREVAEADGDPPRLDPGIRRLLEEGLEIARLTDSAWVVISKRLAVTLRDVVDEHEALLGTVEEKP